MNTYVGLDVAKATLAVCLLGPDSQTARADFDNSAAGHRKLRKWVGAHAPGEPVRYCLEATGGYGEALAQHLAAAGELVSVVNPARIKQFARSQGRRNKTDRIDAQVIAEYARAMQPPPWRPPSPQLRELTALLRRLDDMEQQRQREQVRLQEPGAPALVRRSLQKSLRFLAREIADLERRIGDHIGCHPDLQEKKRLLETIPGIADKTALWFLVVLRSDSAFSSGEALAAFLGLTPQRRESGTSLRGRSRIGKGGGRPLRRTLYWAALSAQRHNPLVREFCRRLTANGKSKMAVLIAAMRKLVLIAYGVLRTRTAFSCT